VITGSTAMSSVSGVGLAAGVARIPRDWAFRTGWVGGTWHQPARRAGGRWW
jgi:hypothetical protein